MAAKSILNSVSKDELNNARLSRDERNNPSDFAPDEDDDFGDLFGDDFGDDSGGSSMGDDSFGFGDSSSGSMGSDPFGSDPFGNSVGGLNGGADPFGSFGASNFGQPAQPQQSSEDKILEAVGQAGKASGNFLKNVFGTFKNTNALFWASYGRIGVIVGVIEAAVGLILSLFKIPNMVSLLMCGIITAGTCAVILMLNVNEGERIATEGGNLEPETPQLDNNFGGDALGSTGDDFGSTGDDDWGFNENTNDDSDDCGDEDDGWEDDDSGWGDDDSGWVDNTDDTEDLLDDDWGTTDNDISDEEFFKGNVATPVDKEDALAAFPEMDSGIVVRQYMFDAIYQVLSEITPGYNKERKYSENDAVFLAFDSKIREAAEVANIKEIPQLLEMKETLLTIELVIERKTKYNADELGAEIAKIYGFDPDTNEINPSVYAKTQTVGTKCYITLFTGETALVSLRDLYNNCKDYICDNKNYMPVVLGIDQKGKIMVTDLKKDDTCMIIAGMPRSGKSWFVQAVLTQMCAFVSPSELNLYFFDPKAKTSDFKRFTLPHVKGFASQYTDEQGKVVNPEERRIMDLLSWVVNTEAPRRKKIIGEAGEVNLWDYKKKNPDVQLPLIYLVFDEMVTLSKMEKEQEKQYQSYLDMIVTQFPNLGIRAMFIPHEVKNQIISKTAYDSVKSRISVKGNEAHIEASTGAKPREFGYKLTHVGDMAVKMDMVNSGAPTFVHGVALSSSNEENVALFEYLRKLWNKIEPEQAANSVAKNIDTDRKLEELQKGIDLDDVDDMDIFGDDDSTGNSVFSEPNSEGVSSLNKEVVDNISDSDNFWDDF